MSKFSRLLAYIIFAAFVLLFLLRYAREVAALGIWPHIGWLLLAVLLAAVAILVVASASWLLVARRHPSSLSGLRFIIVFLRSNLARYAPGGIFGHVARWHEGKGLGVSSELMLLSLLLETVLLLASGTLLALTLLPVAAVWKIILLAIGVVALFLLLTRFLLPFLRLMLRWLKKPISALPPCQLAGGEIVLLLALYSLAFISWAAALSALAAGFSLSLPLFSALGTFALAYIVGYLAVFAPSGLGVREATLTALLLPIFGAALAGLLAIWSRLLVTLGEIVALALVSFWKKFIV